MEFQRARQPEQKAQRRAAILRAARELLDEGGLEALSLTALARRVGLAKSNVYRYFDGREAILLEVFRDGFEGWADELSARLRRVRSKRRVRRLVELMAASYAARARMCELMSILPSVIARNVSAATIAEANALLVDRSRRLAALMHEVVPALPVEAHVELVRYSYVLVAGLWPIAHPPAVVLLAEDPGLTAQRRDLERDLAEGLGLLAEGMLRRRERVASAR